MKLKARDLPSNGAPMQVECNGLLFEVKRVRSAMDGRRWSYAARKLPALNFASGWWYRYGWALMKADIQLMAKGTSNEQ